MDRIIVLNNALAQLDIVSNWKGLSWTRGWNTAGAFELTVNPDDGHTDYLSEGYILYLDDEHIGIIEQVVLQKGGESSADNTLVVSGSEIKEITKRRITTPPSTATSGYDIYNNKTAEYIVRQLITKHIISPEDTARKIPNIAIPAVSGELGSAMTYSTRYKVLQEEIYSILSVDGLGFVATVDFDTDRIVLSVKSGVDRTVSQNTNSRAMFRLSHGTLSAYEQISDYAAYKNTAYVGGQGEGAERQIELLGDNNTSWGRREMFVDARDINESDALATRGQEKLAEVDKSLSLTVQVDTTNNMTYDLGDYVSVYDEINDTWIDSQIVQMDEQYNAGSPYTKEITLGATPMSVGSAVSLKISSQTTDFGGGSYNPDSFGNSNLLHNSNFVDAVNQRNISTYSTAYTYCLDRWMLISGSVSYTQGTGLLLTSANLHQKIDCQDALVGRTLTLSACIDNVIYSVSGVLSTDFVSSGKLAFNWDGSIRCIRARIIASGLLTYAKLEVGSVPTQYVANSYIQEYNRCKYYYYRMYPALGGGRGQMGCSPAITDNHMGIVLNNTMRIPQPVVTYSDLSHFEVCRADVSVKTPISIGTDNYGDATSGTFTYSVKSGSWFTAGTTYLFRAANTNVGTKKTWLAFDAEL